MSYKGTADRKSVRRVSYAQTGQDILAFYWIAKTNKATACSDYAGTYVDIGACYPIKDSNTYFFYERGWRGLCVDANPATGEAFTARRPEDVFARVAIGADDGEMEFHTYTNPQWNGFNPNRAKYRAKTGHYIGSITVRVRRLSDVIDENLPNRHIDFMTIDTEGHEFQVLSSLDLSRHRPTLILIESIRPVLRATSDPAIRFLLDRGYTLKAHTGHDAFLLAE